jgi:asparagine synthase (glutamine-hydrolysing)
MYRYIAFVWNPGSANGAPAKRCIERIAAGHSPWQWSLAHEAPGVLALHVERGHGAGTTHKLPGRTGVVLGQLFDRRCEDYSTAREISFDDAAAAALVSSGGRHLIDHYWGSYLSIIYDETAGRHYVFRDPTGTLPCYHVQQAGADIFFSHLEDCLQLAPFPLKVNRAHFTRWLMFSGVRTNETGLEDVMLLGAGERLTLSRTGRVYSRIWDPTTIASDQSLREPAEAARALRETVQHTVNAWASRYRRITHKVSGGLDSAIIAGCLAQIPSSPEMSYLNLVVDAGQDAKTVHLPGIDAKTAAKVHAIAVHGDERYYARLVAQRWGVPLIERPRQVSMDLSRLEQVPLSVFPSKYFTVLEMDDAELELIDSHGTQAFFSGQAGDSVLLVALRPLPAMDYAHMHGVSRGLWRQIVVSTGLSKESVWSVIGKAVKHGLLRRPLLGRYRLVDRPTLLTEQLSKTLREEDLQNSFAHLARRSTLAPGKRDHIKGISSDFYNYVMRAGNSADHIDPLNSQPVWETALRIPTYTMLTGGVSRGLARHAFADVLPTEIRRRQTKGTGSLFYQQVVRRNRHFLLARLEAGELVGQGFLDRRRLVDCLSADEPSITIPPTIILTYLAAETWLQRLKNSAANEYLNAQPVRAAG